MKKIQILDTELPELFPLGLGTVAAGNRWTEEESFQIFDTFLENGGNVLDTARVYSVIAKSEPIIGEWIFREGKRDQVVLISKGGHADLSLPKWDMHEFRLSFEEMEKDLEDSLNALKTDYIDIYLYHRDDTKRTVEELIETMESFVKKGKIRYYGCSNWSLSRIIEAKAYCVKKGYRGFVMNESLLNIGSDYMNPPWDDTLQIIDSEMQKYHIKEPALLASAFSGNCGGFFHQYLTGGEKAVKDPSYLTPENIKCAEIVSFIAKKYDLTYTQVVMAYFMQLPFACLPLFSPRDAQSIQEVMKVFSMQIPFEEWRL